VSGQSETKKLQDLLPGIITQLGPDNLEDLKKIYAGYAAKEGGMPDLNSVLQQAQQAANNAIKGGGGGDDDDEVPDLVDNFEEASLRTPQ
jgi:nascent polypeptide-associated complex subunit beta